MADPISKDDDTKVAAYIAKHGVTHVNYMLSLPVEPLKRPNTTWGKAKKSVRPIKRVVKR